MIEMYFYKFKNFSFFYIYDKLTIKKHLWYFRVEKKGEVARSAASLALDHFDVNHLLTI